jgi:hypothetical protein
MAGNIKTQWLVFGIFLIALIGGWLCIDPGHEWGDDFILYLHQARCWVRGGMQELAISNQICMDQSDGVIGPYLYPQGFPVLMSLPMRGIDIWGFVGLKVFNYSIFILCMVAVYRWFRLLFEDRMVPVMLSLVLVIWHPKIWEAANRLTSDLWFAGLAGVFMFLLYSQWRNSLAKNLTLGLLVFMATSTRTNGVFLLVPWVLLVWQENPKFYGGLRANGNLILVFVLGGLCGLLALKNDLGHGPVYMNMLKSVTSAQVFSNMGLYLKMIGTYPLWHFSTIIEATLGAWATSLLALCVWAIILLAIVKRGWQLLPIVAFVGVNLALFCAWPSLQGVRLLFVIFPMLAVLVVVGLMELWQLARPFVDVRIGVSALRKSSNWAIALSVIVLVQGLATALHYIGTDTNQAFSKEITEVYSFVESSVKANERISFHKPRLMRYVTGAEVFKVATDIPVNPTDEVMDIKPFDLGVAKKRLASQRINYWILPKSRGMLMGGYVDFPVAFENAKFVVYKVK